MRRIPTSLCLAALLGCATNPAVYFNRAVEDLYEAERRIRVWDLDGAEASYRAALGQLDAYEGAAASGDWIRDYDGERRSADYRKKTQSDLGLLAQARKEADAGGPASRRLRMSAGIKEPTPKNRMDTVLFLLKHKPEGYLDLAVPSLEALAQEGYAEGQFVLGLLYENWEGVPKDERRSHEWQLKAAKQGHAEGAFRIGNDFYQGRRGAPKDVVEAVTWWKKAAEAGHARAQEVLARAYMEGLMGPGQEKEAAAWIERAARSGDASAVQLRDQWRASGRIR